MMTERAETAACPECGKSISIEVTHCPFCERHVARQEIESDNEVVAVRALLKAEREVAETIRCQACGEEFAAQVDKCPRCARHTHQESHFEDRRRGLMEVRGQKMLFYVALCAAVVLLIGWLLFSLGPELPPADQPPTEYPEAPRGLE